MCCERTCQPEIFLCAFYLFRYALYPQCLSPGNARICCGRHLAHKSPPELVQTAQMFEESIYKAATSKEDYFQRIAEKLYQVILPPTCLRFDHTRSQRSEHRHQHVGGAAAPTHRQPGAISSSSRIDMRAMAGQEREEEAGAGTIRLQSGSPVAPIRFPVESLGLESSEVGSTGMPGTHYTMVLE